MTSEKKSSVLYVLEILLKYSDEKHTLCYADIIKKLSSVYGIDIERKTVAKDVDILIEKGYDIIKCGKNGLYLGTRDFEDGELLFLIDAIYSSRSMSTKYAKDLVEKLMSNQSSFTQKKFKNLEKIDDGIRSDNKQLFYNIELLNEAIEKKRKVEFQYNAYDFDKKLKPKLDGKIYKINPYYMVNNKGKYYLICNYDKYDDLSNYKIENITNVRLINEKVKPISELKDGKDFSIKKYMNEHIYMLHGETINAKVKLDSEKFINDFIDWFGKDVSIEKINDEIIASLKVNEETLIYWSLQYGEHVEIIEPLTTRNKCIDMIKQILKKYDINQG